MFNIISITHVYDGIHKTYSRDFIFKMKTDKKKFFLTKTNMNLNVFVKNETINYVVYIYV